MRWPWQRRKLPPKIQTAQDTMEEARKATDEAAQAVHDYWAARAPQQDYAYAERRRIERRKAR